MFKKCLKYDLRAIGKIWLIAAAVVLAIAILGSIGIGSFMSSVVELDSSTAPSTPGLKFFTQLFIGLISGFALISSLAVFLIGTEIAVCLRYYNHLFTDQGYLTFTLPVKRSTLFWSKTVSGYLFTLGSFVMYAIVYVLAGVGLVGGLLAGAIKADGITLWQAIKDIWEMITSEYFSLEPIWEGIKLILTEIGALNIVRVCICFVLLAILGLCALFTSLMISYACITLGATMFRKLKLLSVLVTYYVVNYVLMIPAVYITTYYGMFSVAVGAAALPKLFANAHIGIGVIYLALIVAILATLSVGVALAIFNLTRIERKLNLA